MTPSVLWMSILIVAVGWSATVRSACAASVRVRDAGGFFSPSAIKKAEAKIQEIDEHYEFKVFVETFTSPPLWGKWVEKTRGAEARDRFIDDWAKKNARQVRGNGIYVLISREPAPLQVRIELGPKTDARTFVLAQRDRLRDILATGIGKGQLDQSLEEALGFIHETLQANLGAPLVRHRFPWAEIVWMVAILVAFWLFAEFIQNLADARGGESPIRLEPVGYGSLAAGLFTTMTTNWLGEFLTALTQEVRSAGLEIQSTLTHRPQPVRPIEELERDGHDPGPLGTPEPEGDPQRAGS